MFQQQPHQRLVAIPQRNLDGGLTFVILDMDIRAMLDLELGCSNAALLR